MSTGSECDSMCKGKWKARDDNCESDEVVERESSE